MSGGFVLSGRGHRGIVLTAMPVAAGYIAFSMWGGWRQVGSAMAKVGALHMAAILFMSLVNYGLRFVRWQAYLHALGHPVPWRPSLPIYLAGFALTTTPGKAGEALRGVLLQPWGVPYAKSFAAFFSERLSDLLAIVLLALLGLSAYPDAGPVVAAGVLLVLGGAAVLSQGRAIDALERSLAARKDRLSRMGRPVLQVLAQARRCHSPALLAGATALSIAAWGAEAVAFHWLLGWMGADIPLVFAVFVYAVAMLAGALSFLPGGLGGAEAVMVALLVWKGMPAADAVAATVLTRLATLWFAVAIGLCCLPRGSKWRKESCS